VEQGGPSKGGPGRDLAVRHCKRLGYAQNGMRAQVSHILKTEQSRSPFIKEIIMSTTTVPFMLTWESEEHYPEDARKLYTAVNEKFVEIHDRLLCEPSVRQDRLRGFSDPWKAMIGPLAEYIKFSEAHGERYTEYETRKEAAWDAYPQSSEAEWKGLEAELEALGEKLNRVAEIRNNARLKLHKAIGSGVDWTLRAKIEAQCDKVAFKAYALGKRSAEAA
jgi:hypothetical protein